MSEHLIPWGDLFVNGIMWVCFFFVPMAGACVAVALGLSAPLRRQERARVFLDLLEAGFHQGQRPEAALVQAAGTNDPLLGDSFQQMAAQLQGGARLSEALDEVPKLLPPQVAATLRVGEEMGDARKILPACRRLFKDAESQTRNGFNFMVIANLVLLPTMPILILLIRYNVFPKFMKITEAYDVPPFDVSFMRFASWVAGAQLVLAFFLWCWVWFYIKGPRAYGWVRVVGKPSPPLPLFGTPLWNFIGRPLAPLRDRILYALPWRRRRLQRDFCAALSILLDAGTPEPAAVTMAAEATANHVFVGRARKALRDLASGQNLQTALRRFDKAGEFSWRLANAAAQEGGFLPALTGWMEALDAKAFQQEQTASQLITTGLVLCNGLVVGLIAIGIFSVLNAFEG